MSQEKTIRKIPHIHYVALSRVKRLKDLYILNMNEASMALDDDVNVEMHRLRTEAALELSVMFLCIKLILAKSKLHSTMQDPCINISEMLNLNQMCWQQMPLDLLKRGCAEGMKMYTML